MSTVVPPNGSRSVTAPPTASSQQYPSHPVLSRNHQNDHRSTQAQLPNHSDIELNSSRPPNTPPRTPRRQNHSANGSTHETGSKQKPRNKKPKNVMTSPAMARNGRNTPPMGSQPSAGLPQSSVKPILTPSTAAYAGPTFHASPAPSALPIPSFYSKSVPESPGIKTMKESSQSPPNALPSTKTQAQHEQSPLDFFFKADREEKARARSATLTATKPNGPFVPPAGSPRTSRTPPVSTSQSRPGTSKRISSSGMFAMELDGDNSSGSHYGPSFSTPYSERINAARSNSSMDQFSQDGQQTTKSEALKAYLFSSHSSPSPNRPASTPSKEGTNSPITPATIAVTRHAVTSGGQKSSTAAARAQHNSMGRSSGLRQEVVPARTPTKTAERHSNYSTSPTPSRMYENSNSSAITNTTGAHSASPYDTPTTVNKNSDLKGMEDALRKMLKLDSGSSNITGSNNASAHVPLGPNFAGGKHPSVNGMNNGVSRSS